MDLRRSESSSRRWLGQFPRRIIGNSDGESIKNPLNPLKATGFQRKIWMQSGALRVQNIKQSKTELRMSGLEQGKPRNPREC